MDIWNDIVIDSDREPNLTNNAQIVLEKRYLAKDEEGKVIETPRQMFERIAKY
ncbi:MAG TPA: ribonucleotide reductase N-terminal alpha domain-containing protein, partial [Spirochaetota bacterium]|nr:ribonucleotide reductase N-terminal alpha domain-containing protein [Spirochaetota bacterium]